MILRAGKYVLPGLQRVLLRPSVERANGRPMWCAEITVNSGPDHLGTRTKLWLWLYCSIFEKWTFDYTIRSNALPRNVTVTDERSGCHAHLRPNEGEEGLPCGARKWYLSNWMRGAQTGSASGNFSLRELTLVTGQDAVALQVSLRQGAAACFAWL